KAVSKLVDGFSVDQIESKLLGNQCGFRGTSCADQLAMAVRKAYSETCKE
ncbi:MAG: TSCPD domain-containing protein, partial [Lachnospiraceae bacterium]|nr:TSCPD domain-containing protein [Lachnospiraceae bacterium]